MGGHLASKAPRIAWSMDCAPGLNTSTGRQSISVIVDDFSRFVVLLLIPKLDSASVRQAFLQNILAVYGRPRQIRTDSGKEFQGHFASLLRELDIKHIVTRPVAPWTNGRAERMVRTVKSCLKRVIAANPQVEWTQILPWLQAAINSSVSRTTGFSPHEILFGNPLHHYFPTPAFPQFQLTQQHNQWEILCRFFAADQLTFAGRQHRHRRRRSDRLSRTTRALWQPDGSMVENSRWR